MDSLRFLPRHSYTYLRPTDVTTWSEFMAENIRFYDRQVTASQLALVRASKFDKLYTLLLAVAWTAVCLGIGVVVGVASRNAELGVTVGAALVAVVAFLAFIVGALL